MTLPLDIALNRALGTVAFCVTMFLIVRSAMPNGAMLPFTTILLLMAFILILLGLADVVVALADRYVRSTNLAITIDGDHFAVDEEPGGSDESDDNNEDRAP